MILIKLPRRIRTSQHKSIYSKKKRKKRPSPLPPSLPTSQPHLLKLIESKERRGAKRMPNSNAVSRLEKITQIAMAQPY